MKPHLKNNVRLHRTTGEGATVLARNENTSAPSCANRTQESGPSMTTEEAVRYLRADPQYAGLILNAYLAENVLECAERFAASVEFSEVLSLLGAHVCGARLIDLGAGNGIASYAFGKSGAKTVYAIEPDPSEEIGRGAILRLSNGLPIVVMDSVGEQMPLPDGQVDIVYARQVLHHTRDLFLVLRECFRVLRPGGLFLACREHVVDNDDQLRIFLANHPVHRLAGGENAFPLSTYLGAIGSAGLRLEKVLGPWDSVINAFPGVKTAAELRSYPQSLLKRRFGLLGSLAGLVPGVKSLVWRRIKRPTPGRMYSFLALKP